MCLVVYLCVFVRVCEVEVGGNEKVKKRKERERRGEKEGEKRE